MKLRVRHLTRYEYARSASLSQNHICLQPKNTLTQRILESRVDVNPEPDGIHFDSDIYGNATTRFSLNQRHRECEIVVTSLIETSELTSIMPIGLPLSENLNAIQTVAHQDKLLATDCLLESPFIPISETLDELLAEVPYVGQGVVEYANQMMSHIFNTFTYKPGFTTLVTPLSEIYKERKGVCQDFAHLAIGALRRQGIPTRYVSGYLETLPPPGKPDAQYITTAWGRDYGDVTPIKGVVYGGGKHTLKVEVDVMRAGESEREF